jgi:hypothetical protein
MSAWCQKRTSQSRFRGVKNRNIDLLGFLRTRVIYPDVLSGPLFKAETLGAVELLTAGAQKELRPQGPIPDWIGASLGFTVEPAD